MRPMLKIFPMEIISYISEFLDIQSLISFSLTCKTIYNTNAFNRRKKHEEKWRKQHINDLIHTDDIPGINYFLDNSLCDPEYVIAYTCWSGRLNIVKCMIERDDPYYDTMYRGNTNIRNMSEYNGNTTEYTNITPYKPEALIFRTISRKLVEPMITLNIRGKSPGFTPITYACIGGSLGVVKYLVKYVIKKKRSIVSIININADEPIRNTKSHRILRYLYYHGASYCDIDLCGLKLKSLKYLKEKLGVNINSNCDEAFCHAVKENKLDVAKYFLDQGHIIDPDTVYTHNAQTLIFLIEHGLDVNEKHYDIIYLYNYGYRDFVICLLENDYEMEELEKELLLEYSSEQGDTYIVKYLTEHIDFDPENIDLITNNAVIACVHGYCNHRNLQWAMNNICERAEHILHTYGQTPYAYNQDLHKNLEVFDYLLKNGADKTDLHRVIINHDCLDMFKCLVKHGFNPADDDNYAIKYSSEYGMFNLVKYILTNFFTYPLTYNYDINLAAKLACKNGHLKVVKLLVDYGADVVNNDCIRCVEKTGNITIFEYLLSRGADISKIDLVEIIRNDYYGIAEYLLKYDKKISLDAIFIALDIVEIDSNLYTLLHRYRKDRILVSWDIDILLNDKNI